ncbi:hypothetical protein [Streptomyces sp. N35]|uniref:hypothetical protein n=1 Tax=Streptomyces sp. N35 TaxID=2795730 RepID=UPI0018F51214|nr:hypothetical protein [Streptomyces sp. N35]
MLITAVELMVFLDGTIVNVARQVFAFGLALFTGASVLAGPANDPWLLLTARALQGITAAVTVPAQLALLTRTFTDPAARRRAFGV